MSIDLPAAVAFLGTHGRVLDRRRLELLVHGGDPTAVLAALDGYRNLDGGHGWGLEPDLRSPESQPAGAMHALEVLAEAVIAEERRRLINGQGATVGGLSNLRRLRPQRRSSGVDMRPSARSPSFVPRTDESPVPGGVRARPCSFASAARISRPPLRVGGQPASATVAVLT
jgi:hypothetical protein